MRYRASFLAYAFWVHKNAMPKNWLMRVKGLKIMFKWALYFSTLLITHFNSSTKLFQAAINTTTLRAT